MKRRAGFTLLEVLVSVSTLAVIVLLVAQLLNGASLTMAHCDRLMDSDSQARLIFSKMAEDFAAMVNRPDLDFYFHSAPGNDEFYFYSHSSGYIAPEDPAGTSAWSINTPSLIGYRVSDAVSSGARAELERLARGLHWIDTAGQTGTNGRATSLVTFPALVKDAFSSAISDPFNNSSNPNTADASTHAPEWDVIGEKVFRMEFCFLLKDGTFSQKPAGTTAVDKDHAPASSDDTTAGYTPGSRWYDTSTQTAYQCVNAAAGAASWVPLGLRDVKAVVVTIALMDDKTPGGTPMASVRKAIALFPDFDAARDAANPMQVTWSPAASLADSVASSTGLNSRAASSIHVYERFFYLK